MNLGQRGRERLWETVGMSNFVWDAFVELIYVAFQIFMCHSECLFSQLSHVFVEFGIEHRLFRLQIFNLYICLSHFFFHHLSVFFLTDSLSIRSKDWQANSRKVRGDEMKTSTHIGNRTSIPVIVDVCRHETVEKKIYRHVLGYLTCYTSLRNDIYKLT